MAVLQDTLQLDITQYLRQLSSVDAAITRLYRPRATPALPFGNLAGVTAGLGNTSGASNQLGNLERSILRLTLASNANLGAGRALSGLFAFLPGPIGLFASATSFAASALTGLTGAQKLNTIGAFAFAGGLAAIVGATALLASRGVEQLKEFQSAANILDAQAPGVSASLDAKVRDLQSQGGRPAEQFNRAELAAAVADLTKQGLAEADAYKLVATSLKLAGAEGQNLNESSGLLLQNLRQFGKDGPEAAAAAADFGDRIAKASLLAASGAKELQQGLAVVGPIAREAGFSLDQTLGTLVALDNVGLKASTVGANAFRAVLLALASPTGKAREEIERLGVATRTLSGGARPVVEILADLRKAAGVSGDQYDKATQSTLRQADSVEAASTIFRSRGVVGFLNMADSADKYTAAVQGSSGALTKFADVLTEGPAKAQERLKKAFDDLSLSFAQTFGPKLTAGLDNVSGFFRDIDELSQHPDTFKTYADAVATGIGGITVALTLNTLAANGALGVGGYAGFVKLVEGSVVGGIFVKAAALVRTLKLEIASGWLANGALGVVAVLGAIPALIAGAIVVTTLLATAAIAANFKIAGDIKHTYDEIDKAGQDQQNKLLARASQLADQGPLGKLKAKQLLTIDLRYNYEQSPEAIAKLDAQLLRLKQQITAQTASDAAVLAAQSGKAKDVAASEEQTIAYEGMVTKLDELKNRFSATGQTAFQKNLIDQRKALADFSKEIDDLVSSGKITAIYGETLTKRREAAQPIIVQGIVQRQLDDDKKIRIAHEKDVQSAQLALVKDGTEKRRLEVQQQIAEVRRGYADQITEALKNAKSAPDATSRRQFYADAAVLQKQQKDQEVAVQTKADRDIADLQKASARKLLDAQKATQQEQIAVITAGAAELTQSRDAALARTSDPSRQLAIEQQYAGQLLALRRQGIDATRQLNEQAAARQLSDDLQAAQDGGSQRIALEIQARNRYASTIRALEINGRTELSAAVLEEQNRQNEALAKLYQKQVDSTLKSIREVEGGELVSIQRRLAARLVLAEASGNTPLQGVIQGALDTVTDQIVQNATDFRDRLRESRQSAVDLQTKLADVARTPLQKAEASAASPFNDIINTARTDLDGLNKAFAKVAEPSAAQTAGYRSQQATLTQIIQSANVERNQAILTADQAFYRARDDKAAEAALKLGKTQFDGGTISDAAYRKSLNASSAYWNQRLQVAVKGSADEDAANQHLADNDAERDRIRQAALTQREDGRNLTREELASQVALASTEAGRVRARAQLVQDDAARLVSVQKELSTLQATGGKIEDIQKLERERLAILGNLNTASEEEKQRQADTRQFTREQLVGELALARTDEDRARLRGQLFAGDQLRLVSAQAELSAEEARGGTAERTRKLKTEILGLETGIKTQQDEQLQRTDALLASQLGLVGAEEARQVAMARTNAEVAASKVAAVGQSARELSDVDRRIAQARAEGKTQADINALLTEREGKATSLYQAQRDAARYGIEVSQQQLDLDEARQRATLQLTGMADDALASAVTDLDVTRRQVAFIDQQLAQSNDLKLTEAEINALQVKRLGLIGQEADQQRKIIEAERQRRDLIEAINLGAGSLGREQAGGSPGQRALSDAEGGVSDARARLAQATRAYSEAQADLNKGQSSTNLQKFASAQDALTGAIVNQRKAVQSLASAYRDQISSMDSVRDATDKLRAVAPGAQDVPVAEQFDRLFAIQARRDQALREVQAAIRSGDAKLIASSTSELTAQQDRYNKQADMLGKSGVQVTRQGDTAVQDVVRQLDKLGVTYDQEAANLAQRATAADKESEAAVVFSSATDRLPGIFEVGAQQLREAIEKLRTVVPAPAVATPKVPPEKKEADKAPTKRNEQNGRPEVFRVAAEDIRRAVEGAISPAMLAYYASPLLGKPSSTIDMRNVRGGDTITINIPITLDGQPVPTPDEFRQIARGEIAGAIQNARRDRAWKAKDC